MRQLELRFGGFREAPPEPYRHVKRPEPYRHMKRPEPYRHMNMNLNKPALTPPIDGRQSETALRIARGTARLLHLHGYSVVSELPLPSGRRADLVALGDD